MTEPTLPVIIPMIDEEGNEVQFEHLMTFEHLGEHYVALMPIDEVEEMDEDEVLILHVIEEDGDTQFESVDNDILLDEVFAVFLQILDEQEEEDSE